MNPHEALPAAGFRLQRIAGGKVRGAAEPTGQDGVWTQFARFASEDNDGLRDFLGQMRIAHLPQRRRMDERHRPFHELRKGGRGLVGGIGR